MRLRRIAKTYDAGAALPYLALCDLGEEYDITFQKIEKGPPQWVTLFNLEAWRL